MLEEKKYNTVRTSVEVPAWFYEYLDRVNERKLFEKVSLKGALLEGGLDYLTKREGNDELLNKILDKYGVKKAPRGD